MPQPDPSNPTEPTVAADPLEAEPVDGAPSRSIGTRLWFYWYALVAVLATIPFSIIQLVSHQFAPTARNFKRWARGWGRTILRLIGVRCRLVERSRLDPTKPYVFVSNHQNLLDIMVLADVLPYPFGFIAKAELAGVPFLGYAIRNSASLFIDKREPRKAVKSLREAGERIRNGNSVLVFPEGMRGFRRRLHPLKKGAFTVAVEAGVPVVPVTICNSYTLMDERHHAARPGTIVVVIGRPIDIEGKTRRDIPEIMDAVRLQIEAELTGGCGGEIRS